MPLGSELCIKQNIRRVGKKTTHNLYIHRVYEMLHVYTVHISII